MEPTFAKSDDQHDAASARCHDGPAAYYHDWPNTHLHRKSPRTSYLLGSGGKAASQTRSIVNKGKIVCY